MKCKFEGKVDAWGECPCMWGNVALAEAENCIGYENCILFEEVDTDA